MTNPPMYTYSEALAKVFPFKCVPNSDGQLRHVVNFLLEYHLSFAVTADIMPQAVWLTRTAHAFLIEKGILEDSK